MGASTARKRQRGDIETLPSGSRRVKVYAGVDPVTGKRHYLNDTVTPGPTASRDAEKARTRFLAQVDERRNPRTRATMRQLLDRWLEVLDVDVSMGSPYGRFAALNEIASADTRSRILSRPGVSRSAGSSSRNGTAGALAGYTVPWCQRLPKKLVERRLSLLGEIRAQGAERGRDVSG
jgi:hypothetical protein